MKALQQQLSAANIKQRYGIWISLQGFDFAGLNGSFRNRLRLPAGSIFLSLYAYEPIKLLAKVRNAELSLVFCRYDLDYHFG